VVVGLGGMGMLLPTAKVVVTAIMVVVERVSGPHTVAPVVVADTSKVFSLVLPLGKLLHTLVWLIKAFLCSSASAFLVKACCCCAMFVVVF
jgi:hypothetical protein